MRTCYIRIMLTLFYISIFGVASANYEEYWSHGVADHTQGDDWWFDIGGRDSYASDYLAATSPFYRWFKQAQTQYDMFAPALHVGKINRGTFLNPELNLPADRAIGHKPDFHDAELFSGAFEYRPHGQKIVARKVDVDAGIAKRVGEVIKLSLATYVKKDGTLLVNVGGGNPAHPGDPCTRQPDPCADFPTRPRCVAIHAKCHAVKCVGPVKTTISLKFDDPNSRDHKKNDIDLFLVPSTSDGKTGPCKSVLGPGDDVICGVTMDKDKKAMNNKKTETAVLSIPRDFTYAVLAAPKLTNTYKVEAGSLQLTVKDDTYGYLRAVQILRVPEDEGNLINPDNKEIYFFGCLYPHTNKINIEKTGFYNFESKVGHTGLLPFAAGLCKALQKP